MASYPASQYRSPERDSGAAIKLLALFLGLVVVIMGTIGLWLALSAQHARDDANLAARGRHGRHAGDRRRPRHAELRRRRARERRRARDRARSGPGRAAVSAGR